MLLSHSLERLIGGHRGPGLDGEQGIRHEDDDYYRQEQPRPDALFGRSIEFCGAAGARR